MAIPRALLPVSCCPFVGEATQGTRRTREALYTSKDSGQPRKKKNKETKENKKLNQYLTAAEQKVASALEDPPRSTLLIRSETQHLSLKLLQGVILLEPPLTSQNERMFQLRRQVGLAIKQRLQFSAYPTLTSQEGLTIGWLGLKECYFGWGQGWFINKCTGLLEYRSRLLFSGHGRPSGYLHLPWLS